MLDVVEQLSTYKSSHLNLKNIKTHIIGIPLIVWAIMVLMSLVRFSTGEEKGATEITLAMVFIAIILFYYFILHTKLAIGMLFFILPALYSAEMLARSPNAATIAIITFIVGWGFQFLGHVYEKAKPAFIDDLKQLLIGPFFLMAELFFALGIEKELESNITPIALKKRKELEAKKKKRP